MARKGTPQARRDPDAQAHRMTERERDSYRADSLANERHTKGQSVIARLSGERIA